MGRRPTKDNNLLVKFPLISHEWHPDKNLSLKPDEFLPFSAKKVWWLCPKGHSYDATISNRTSRGSGCPYCAGKRVTNENSFAILHPEKASEWDYEKNVPLLPEDFSQFSGKKVWWKCKKNHEWETRIADRSQGNNCPFCWKHTSIPEFRLLSELEHIFGSVIRRRKFSGSEVDLYIEKYRIGIEYDGSYWHKDKEDRDRDKEKLLSGLGLTLIRVRERPLEKLSDFDVLTSQRGLKKEVINTILNNIKTYCDNEDTLKINEYISESTFQNEDVFRKYQTDVPEPDIENSLAVEDESLIAEFDYEKNFPLEPKSFSRGSQQKVWWRCNQGHSWETTVLGRTINRTGCPYCSNNFASDDFNLEVKYPDMSEMWHPTKNGDLKPSDVLPMSNLKRWWQCENNHEWEATVSNVTRHKSGCPYCAGTLATDTNNLAVVYPNVKKFWHPTKNKDLRPEEFTPSSGRKVWFICSKGHEWQNKPSNMTSALKGEVSKICPTCRRYANSLQENFPYLVKEWDFEKNSDVHPRDVSYGTNKKYWWRCEKGHSWEASVSSRTRTSGGSGCPICYKSKHI